MREEKVEEGVGFAGSLPRALRCDEDGSGSNSTRSSCSSITSSSSSSSSWKRKLRVFVLAEPNPITYVSGQSVRYQKFLDYLIHQEDEVHLVTTNPSAASLSSTAENDNQERSNKNLCFSSPSLHRMLQKLTIHATFGIRMVPVYPTLTLSADWTLKVLRVIGQQRPDLIHVTSPGFLLFGAIVASRLFQIPLVMSYHTHLPIYARNYLAVDGSRDGGRGGPLRFFWQCASRVIEFIIWNLLWMVHSFADLTIVTSPQMYDEFQAKGIVRNSSTGMAIWPKAIDTADFHPRKYSAEMRDRMTGGHHPHDPLVVHIGRLGAEKRLQDLKPILERLTMKVRQADGEASAEAGGEEGLRRTVRLCVVGTGPSEDRVRHSFASEASSDPSSSLDDDMSPPVVFLGQLLGSELHEAFASGDVFVMPSDSETLGFVVMESMASGVPCVAADAGGIRNIIADGETGFLVPTGDVEAFADRIQRLLPPRRRRQRRVDLPNNGSGANSGIEASNPNTDNELRQCLSEAGRKEMERYSWENSLEAVRHDFYDQAQANFHDRFEQQLWRFLLKSMTPSFEKKSKQT